MGLEQLGLNRTQLLVLGFFIFAWVALVVILVAAPGSLRAGSCAFLAVSVNCLRSPSWLRISVFLVLLGVGVVRRWRWTFWLVLVAFLIGGVLRVPASILQLSGVLAAAFPAWYVLLQALIGVVQVAIGLLMASRLPARGVMGKLLRGHWLWVAAILAQAHP